MKLASQCVLVLLSLAYAAGLIAAAVAWIPSVRNSLSGLLHSSSEFGAGLKEVWQRARHPLKQLINYQGKRRGQLEEAKQASVWAWALLKLFSAVSFPVGFLQFVWAGDPRTMEERRRARLRIDLWIVFWASFTPICLFVLIPRNPSFVVFPILRLFDMFYILLWLLISPDFRPQRLARSATFLLLHYIEIMLIFACAYLSVQELYRPETLFKTLDSCPLNSWTALYFSFVTAATVGYGDTTPVKLISQMLVGFELVFFFFLGAIDIPYVLSGRDSTMKGKTSISAARRPPFE